MNLIYIIGAVDAAVIALMGLVAAGFFLAGKEDWGIFSQRVFPATAVLIGTSFAAGLIWKVTEWLSG